MYIDIYIYRKRSTHTPLLSSFYNYHSQLLTFDVIYVDDRQILSTPFDREPGVKMHPMKLISASVSPCPSSSVGETLSRGRPLVPAEFGFCLYIHAGILSRSLQWLCLHYRDWKANDRYHGIVGHLVKTSWRPSILISWLTALGEERGGRSSINKNFLESTDLWLDLDSNDGDVSPSSLPFLPSFLPSFLSPFLSAIAAQKQQKYL
jgi:hypothetical protein